MSRDGGKGDARRPLHVTEEQFESNWDTIFKKPVKTYTGGVPHHTIDDWMSDKGYQTGDLDKAPTYEDRMAKPKRKMIDPPSGWKYGFPKEIPEHVDNTRDWLIQNGYPQAEIDKCGDSFFVRGWYE